MTLTVDQTDVAAGEHNLSTVEDALKHASAGGRLVVTLLVDGNEPEDGQLASVRAMPLAGRCVYIETADGREMAEEALAAIAEQVGQAEGLRQEAVKHLQAGSLDAALPALSRCFSIWLGAQGSLRAVCELCGLPISTENAAGAPLVEMLREFTAQLRQLKEALEARDYVLVSDVLAYEMEHSAGRWQDAIIAVRNAVAAAAGTAAGTVNAGE